MSRAPAALLAPYPRGRWRLVDSAQLEHVIVWVSHILIRHADVTPSTFPFRPELWRGAPDVPDRTRSEALVIARSLAEKARAQPETFGELATKHSEDLATRDSAGSLGGAPAGHLIEYPELLDALAAIRPGEVSDVVESEYGFHILMRRAPVSENSVVSGQRIVIGYDDAGWLRLHRRGELPRRSRNEALALAQRIYREARERPGSFDSLVDRYTEHVDAVRAGDVGSWSTLEAAPIPRELEVLQRTPVGEVAPPLDSAIGFQILRRTPERPRRQLAMTAIRLAFDHAKPQEQQGSRRSVIARAQALLGTLAGDSSAFPELQSRHSDSRGIDEWTEGRGEPALEAALLSVAPGEIVPRPIFVQVRDTYFIVKRMEPSTDAAVGPAASVEMPAPPEPDAAFLISQGMSRRDAVDVLRNVGSKAVALPEVAGDVASRIAEAHDFSVQTLDELPSDEIAARIRSLTDNMREILGSSEYEAYRQLLARSLEDAVLRPSPALGVASAVGPARLDR